jgi:hypothetical protein
MNGPSQDNKRSHPDHSRTATAEEVFEVLKQLLELFPMNGEPAEGAVLQRKDHQSTKLPTVGDLRDIHTELAVLVQDALMSAKVGLRLEEYLKAQIREQSNRNNPQGNGGSGNDQDGGKS